MASVAIQAALAVGPGVIMEIIKDKEEQELEDKCNDASKTFGAPFNVCMDSDNGPLLAYKPFQFDRKWEQKDGEKIFAARGVPNTAACNVGCTGFEENAASNAASAKNYNVGDIGHSGNNLAQFGGSGATDEPKSTCVKTFDGCWDGVSTAVSNGKGFGGPYGTMDMYWHKITDEDDEALCQYNINTPAAYCNEGCGLTSGEFAPYRGCAKSSNCYLWNKVMWQGEKPSDPVQTKCGKSDCEKCNSYICAPKDYEFNDPPFDVRQRLMWQNTPKCVSKSVDAVNDVIKEYTTCREKYGCKSPDTCKQTPCNPSCITSRTGPNMNMFCYAPTYDKDSDTLTAKCLYPKDTECTTCSSEHQISYDTTDFSIGEASKCAEIDYNMDAWIHGVGPGETMSGALQCKRKCTSQEWLDGNYDTLCKDKNDGDCAFEHTVEVGDCYSYKGKRWAGKGPEPTGRKVGCKKVSMGSGRGTRNVGCRDEYYNDGSCGSKTCKACPTKSVCAKKCGDKTQLPDTCLETKLQPFFMDGMWTLGLNCNTMPDEQSCDAANSFAEFGGEGVCKWTTDAVTGKPGCFKKYLDNCTMTPGMVTAVSKPYTYKHDDGRSYYGLLCVKNASECPAGSDCAVLSECPNSDCGNAFGNTCCRVDGTDGGGGKTPAQWKSTYSNPFAPGAFDECNFYLLDRSEKYSWNGWWWYGKKPSSPAATRCGQESCCPVPGSNAGIPEYETYGNGGTRKSTKYLTPPEGMEQGDTVEYLLWKELQDVKQCFTPELQDLVNGSTEIRDAGYKACMNDSLKSYFDQVEFQDYKNDQPMTDEEFRKRPTTCDAVKTAPPVAIGGTCKNSDNCGVNGVCCEYFMGDQICMPRVDHHYDKQCYAWNGKLWKGEKPSAPVFTKCGKSDCEECETAYVCPCKYKGDDVIKQHCGGDSCPDMSEIC